MKKLKYQDINIKLINACRKGDSKAQFEIYRLYYKSMYNSSLRILGDTAEAEDVMQEGFLSAFQKIDTYKGEVSFGAWLKKIIVNRSLDIIKSRKAVISIETAKVDLPDESDSGYIEKLDDVNINMIKEAIYLLPEGAVQVNKIRDDVVSFSNLVKGSVGNSSGGKVTVVAKYGDVTVE